MRNERPQTISSAASLYTKINPFRNGFSDASNPRDDEDEMTAAGYAWHKTPLSKSSAFIKNHDT
jgi:hypothetical protein